MKRLLLITLLIGYIYPCVAQDKPIRTEESLKEQIHFKPIEEGKQLNYIMLAWMQKPQGKLPPLPPPGSLM